MEPADGNAMTKRICGLLIDPQLCKLTES